MNSKARKRERTQRNTAKLNQNQGQTWQAPCTSARHVQKKVVTYSILHPAEPNCVNRTEAHDDGTAAASIHRGIFHNIAHACVTFPVLVFPIQLELGLVLTLRSDFAVPL